MLQVISHYLHLIRFSHTFFALPFALLSYAMALKLNFLETPPIPFRWGDIVGILLCMVFARGAAMGFNRYTDRYIDAKNPRTASRHLPSGILSATNVLLFVLLCSAGFVGSTLLFLPNILPLVASLPVLFFLLGYSYCKRWTSAAHFWLGTALMLAPLAAWVVVRPPLFLTLPFLSALPIPPVFLGLGVLFWTAGFDLIYATQDADIDKNQGLHSIPGRYGITAALRLSAVCHVLAVFFWGLLPFFYTPFGIIFWIGVALAAVVLAVEHFIVIPRQGRSVDLVRINVAFFHLNILVSLGLLIIGTLDCLF